MKLKNLISLALLAVVAILSSCSDDGYWDAYTPAGNALYSFQSKSSSFSFGSADKPAAINVIVTRGSSEGDVKIPVVANFSDDALSGDSLVTFKAGETTAEYTINIASDIEAGNYTANITLGDSTYLAASGIYSSSVKLTIEYTWEKWCDGSMIDNWMEVSNSVEVWKAAGAPVYRIIKPFWENSLETWWEDTVADAEKAVWTTDMIEFSVDAEGLIYYTRFLYAPYDLDSGDFVYGYHPSDYNTAYDEQYSPMNAVVSETEVQFMPIMYVPGLGGFGPQQLVLDISESGKTF